MIHWYNGITLWGSTYRKYVNQLKVMQKKAVRCIYNMPYNTPTLPLFKESKLLYLNQLYEFEMGKFMKKVSNKTVPEPIQRIFTSNIDVHNHNTRRRGAPHVLHRNSVTASTSIIHKAPMIWNRIPHAIQHIENENAYKNALKSYILNNI